MPSKTTQTTKTTQTKSTPTNKSTAGIAKKTPSGKTETTSLTIGATSATVMKHPKSTTLRLVRVIKAPAARIYQCFIDPDAMAKWLPPHGFTGKVHKIDARVGGSYRMSFATIDRKWSHAFGGVYKELVPAKRIVHTDKFEDPAMGDSEMTVTIDFKPVKGGTQLTIVQEGIPAGPAADGAPYGWSQSLDNLANMCEAELPF